MPACGGCAAETRATGQAARAGVSGRAAVAANPRVSRCPSVAASTGVPRCSSVAARTGVSRCPTVASRRPGRATAARRSVSACAADIPSGAASTTTGAACGNAGIGGVVTVSAVIRTASPEVASRAKQEGQHAEPPEQSSERLPGTSRRAIMIPSAAFGRPIEYVRDARPGTSEPGGEAGSVLRGVWGAVRV